MQVQRITVLNLISIDSVFFQSCFWYCSDTVEISSDSELNSALYCLDWRKCALRVLSPLEGMYISSEIKTSREDTLW